MFKKTILLVSLMIMSLKANIKYKIDNEDWEIDENKKLDVFYNDLQLQSEQYLMNRVLVTGVIMTGEKPSQSDYVTVDSDFDLREGEDQFEMGDSLELPSFELEYGREPLEYFISMMKLKYGLDVVPNNSIGLSNQYGFSLKDSGSEFLGSKMSDYVKDADNVSSLVGPLIGTYLTTAYNVDPDQIAQTNMDAEVEWDSTSDNLQAVPMTNIVYLLNLKMDGNNDISTFGKTTKFNDVASIVVKSPKENDHNFIISRAILLENSLGQQNFFESLNSLYSRVLV